jgi:hypothetical protein
MKVEVLLNGTTKIVLIPENDIEIAILKSVAAGGVDATSISQHTQILDKIIQDGLVISPQKTEVKTDANKGVTEVIDNPA